MKNRGLLKDFLRYGFFNILGMISISFYILADTYFIANGIGVNALSALNICLPIYNLIFGIGLMISLGSASIYSIYFNKGDRNRANAIFTNAFKLLLFPSIIFLFAGIFFAKKLSIFLGANYQTLPYTTSYLRVLFIFGFAFNYNHLFMTYVRNDNNPKLEMVAMVIGSISNVILDYIFIYPLKMGMFGAIIATCISPLISITISLYHFKSKACNLKLIKTKFYLSDAIKFIKNGFPIFINDMSSGVVLFIFNKLLFKNAGNNGIAAYGIIANISIVTIAIFNGLSQGSQPLFSKYYSQKNKVALKKILNYSLITTLCLATISYILVNIFSSQITMAFNNENNIGLTKIALKGIRIYFIGIFFAGINIIIAMFFTSINIPSKSFMLNILRGFIFIIPFSLILSKLFAIQGVWLSYPIAEFVTTIYCLFNIKKYKEDLILIN